MASRTDAELVRTLAALAKGWGGGVHRISEETYQEELDRAHREMRKLRTDDRGTDTERGKFFERAPFTSEHMGVIYERKVVLYVDTVSPYSLIHELGHVFASDKHPQVSDEYEFFGWEYALVRHVRASVPEWTRNHTDYQVGDDLDQFGTMSEKMRREIVRERLEHARANGLVDRKALKPLSIR